MKNYKIIKINFKIYHRFAHHIGFFLMLNKYFVHDYSETIIVCLFCHACFSRFSPVRKSIFHFTTNKYDNFFGVKLH